ncbi:unnamed protein product [Hyaloperonospora brassicae]|uniref:RxLR effector candidate protein n=1 Tax=Hyaloperonospora brassicae TaxID=162125 RepID=A0AAV0TEP4_HYABA|nr:unnamed protein product [Hyaloperonospora brassicae]
MSRRCRPRRHGLLLSVAILSLTLLSSADDAGKLPATPAVLLPEPYEQPTPADRFSIAVWSQALLATALVGTAPVLVLLAVPLGTGNSHTQQSLLRVFLSFAAGGLLGDALLHLLPHSLPATTGGILSFLLLEKFVRAQSGASTGHSHGHSHAPSASVQDGTAVATKATTARKRSQLKEGKDGSDIVEEKELVVPAQEQKKQKTTSKPVAAAAYLNLAADFSHNFTDGLAIGATFVRGKGWTTTVAMLLHELPHEIGDFAILIQSGFTRREAMATQLVTAVGAMIGTVIGLLVEGAGESNAAWISPFTAGGFIYIACASVMPELLADCSLAQSLKEAAAMCAGIGLMALIALNE